MKELLNFLRQTVPKTGREMPGYYRRALVTSEALIAVYYVICFFVFPWATGQWMAMPLVMFIFAAASLWSVGRVNARFSFYAHLVIVLFWSCWFTYTFGWGCGIQHFLIPLLMFGFFNIYEKPWIKIAIFGVLVTIRTLLFVHTLQCPPVISLEQGPIITFQVINSFFTFIILAISFICFSSSIQATERELRLDNQKLHKEAATDPLTGLYNRRSMMDILDEYKKSAPNETFSIAIADIDFFKNVNDTYGHNCGDYTLKELAALFLASSESNYTVCRWGGEEFCFFLPGKNLDEAGHILFDVQLAAKKMQLNYEGQPFKITITVGVAENDFRSSMKEILEQADQKLYRGKMAGRDRVVL